MKESGFLIPTDSRLLLVAVLAVSTLVLAGCATNEDYSTSVSEPTNGTVIQNLSVYDINEMDGARYELEYRLKDRNNIDYTINRYERKNRSYELVTTSVLTGHEPTYKNDLSPLWGPGAERIYRLTVVRTDSETVVDAVTITLKRDEG